MVLPLFDKVIIIFLVGFTNISSSFRGDMHPALWGAKVGNSWRTTGDIADTWER